MGVSPLFHDRFPPHLQSEAFAQVPLLKGKRGGAFTPIFSRARHRLEIPSLKDTRGNLDNGGWGRSQKCKKKEYLKLTFMCQAYGAVPPPLAAGVRTAAAYLTAPRMITRQMPQIPRCQLGLEMAPKYVGPRLQRRYFRRRGQ